MAFISEDHRKYHRIVEACASYASSADEACGLLDALAWYDRMLDSLAGGSSAFEAANMEIARLRAEVAVMSESLDRVKREQADTMGRVRRLSEFLAEQTNCVDRMHSMFGRWAKGE